MRGAAPGARRAPVTFDQAPDGTVTLQPGDLPTWQQYINDFDGAIGQVQSVLADLQGQTPPTDPTALDAYNQLVEAGKSWLSRLQALQSMRDSVSSWASGIVSSVQSTADIYAQSEIPLGSIGLPGVPRSAGMPRSSQLGIVPLLIAGVGLAAFAAVVYGAIQWANQASRFSQLNRMAADAIAKGADPSTAYAQAGRTLNITAGAPGAPGIIESLGSKVIWAGAFLVLAIWALPKLLDRFGPATSRGE